MKQRIILLFSFLLFAGYVFGQERMVCDETVITSQPYTVTGNAMIALNTLNDKDWLILNTIL